MARGARQYEMARSHSEQNGDRRRHFADSSQVAIAARSGEGTRKLRYSPKWMRNHILLCLDNFFRNAVCFLPPGIHV
jgi:hypothetical protein